MVATHRLRLPYSSYVQSMLIPTIPTLPWPIIAYYTYQSLIPSSRTYQEHHSPHNFTLTPHTDNDEQCHCLSKHILVSPNDGSFFKISKSHITLKSTSSFQELFERSKRISHQVLLKDAQDPGFKASFQPRLVHL